MNTYFEDMIKELSLIDAIKAIALGGSRASGRHDAASDYDVYIYCDEPVPYESRKVITDKYCEYMELGNTYYEMEDDGRLKNGIVIELIYRDMAAFSAQLKSHLEDYIAYGGYTTCFYANLMDCLPLYDPEHYLKDLKDQYPTYPEQLRANIITKNRALLSGVIPSLDDQIKKAVKRLDYPSINHRITEYLASYFDVVFAYNRIPHPGEKRMIQLAEDLCTALPNDMKYLIETMIKATGSDVRGVPGLVDQLTEALDNMLKQQKALL